MVKQSEKEEPLRKGKQQTETKEVADRSLSPEESTGHVPGA